MARKLNARQAEFLRLYLGDPERNAKRAYIAAGYKSRGHAAEVGASQLLRQPEIAAEIARVQAEAASLTVVSAKAVIERLWAEAHYFGTGSSHGARVKANEVLCRHFGILNDRLKVETDQPSAKPLAALTDDQLRALLNALPPAPAGG